MLCLNLCLLKQSFHFHFMEADLNSEMNRTYMSKENVLCWPVLIFMTFGMYMYILHHHESVVHSNRESISVKQEGCVCVLIITTASHWGLSWWFLSRMVRELSPCQLCSRSSLSFLTMHHITRCVVSDKPYRFPHPSLSMPKLCRPCVSLAVFVEELPVWHVEDMDWSLRPCVKESFWYHSMNL